MAALESPTAAKKVVVLLRATGDAPILKQAKFKMPGSDKFVKVIDFLRRQLHKETLFVYINSAFSPSPDELVIDLYNKIPGGGWMTDENGFSDELAGKYLTKAQLTYQRLFNKRPKKKASAM